MQLNKEYEAEVNLKSLFFYILYRWRSILIVAIIAATLLGAYKFISMKKTENAAKLASETHQDKPLTQEEQNYIRKIEDRTKQIEELESYLRESVYIQQSYQGIWTASCKYLIKADSLEQELINHGSFIDPVDSILPIYSYPLSGASHEELTEIFGTDKEEYIDELVETRINTNENSLSVSVKGGTIETAQKGLEYIQKRISSVSQKAQELGSHVLIDIGDNIVLAVDRKLKDRKSTLTNALEQNRKDLQMLSQNLEDLRSSGNLGVRKETVIKFFFIGFILGGFMMICLYVIRYLTLGRMNDERILVDKYNLPILGTFVRSGSLHHNKGLDKWISKWELGINQIDSETTYNNIGAIINEYQDVDSILIVSTLRNEKLEAVRSALTARVSEKTIDFNGDFLTNSEAITTAAQKDAVILVEEKGKSLNREIDRMAETLMISHSNVIGAIVL